MGYRPPWLWSVSKVLELTSDVDAIVVFDPVENGHDFDDGPHNCGECDERVQTAIKDYNRRQDPSVFKQVECDYQIKWSYVLEAESSYAQPLTR